MGGLLGGLMEGLFGKNEVPEANWDEIAKLMKMGIQENRYDTNGLFTSQNWDEGKHNLTQSVNPQIQGGMDAMLSRVNEGTEKSPQRDKFAALQAAYERGDPIRPNRGRRERPERGGDRNRPVARGPGAPQPMGEALNEYEQARKYKGYV